MLLLLLLPERWLLPWLHANIYWLYRVSCIQAESSMRFCSVSVSFHNSKATHITVQSDTPKETARKQNTTNAGTVKMCMHCERDKGRFNWKLRHFGCPIIITQTQGSDTPPANRRQPSQCTPVLYVESKSLACRLVIMMECFFLPRVSWVLGIVVGERWGMLPSSRTTRRTLWRASHSDSISSICTHHFVELCVLSKPFASIIIFSFVSCLCGWVWRSETAVRPTQTHSE